MSACPGPPGGGTRRRSGLARWVDRAYTSPDDRRVRALAALWHQRWEAAVDTHTLSHTVETLTAEQIVGRPFTITEARVQGQAGGLARAKALSPRQRTASATKAAVARWGSVKTPEKAVALFLKLARLLPTRDPNEHVSAAFALGLTYRQCDEIAAWFIRLAQALEDHRAARKSGQEAAS